jgi:mono/diheme cytochrome c family protein
MNRLSAVALPALLVAVVAGCPQQDSTPDPAARPAAPGAPATPAASGPEVAVPEGMDAQLVQQGREVYHGAGLCFTCHGQNGVGGPLGPALNDTEWINIATGSLAEIETVIRTGVSQPREYPAPMPAMGGAQLSSDQVSAVSAYVYAISHAGP